ncbi:TPA: nitrate/nitrite two-component system sensor histidine kinase NarX [Klebsiella pneumoniae]|nr:nitrate/nitrite two-component system sensor histidine kinase NarX [Klebsiella pneumoniae]HCJ1854791.1 nitrate/nitrite two-component system sensor histidine kinase NarX [Klebsiella pneumoniae]HCJ1865643.1 nitrate/nitrite two-component system sensor histidine kinase NarX [Klebsiella pneumoniae]HCJ2163144.1 nitrate/nitrite two-component system sensor histidine kinase NarX [Klebsiella pneumoniae]HCJ2209059.1 nitrate/nitrite two-component system sensor histidine kinase NarX [Klebsiella pneumoniae
MLKRLFTPLTLVNQLALIVLLATIIGVAGMAISARLVNGVQGSAHAINKAGSLRMQSYRLLAAIPLNENDQKLVADMTATVFSPELQNSARRDGQEIQLKALQQYWQLALAPGMQRAVNQAEVAQDVADFVDRIDQLVTAFDHTTEQRIERVVWIHRILAIGMALLLIFTIIWLRARLLRPWKQLLSMARAVSQRDFTQRAHISGRNEMATLGMALNNMSEELAESYAVLERRVQEKTAGLEQKNEILAFLWQANRRLHSSAPLCERISPVLNGLQGLTLLRDIEVRVYDLEDEDNHQEFTCHSDDDCDDKGCYLCPRNLPPLPDGGTTLKWRLSDAHSQYGILLATLPVGRHLSHDQQQLVDTLVEQLTSTLALDRHQEKQQQLIVMEERATIARELHDSIAQSLSCMKIDDHPMLRTGVKQLISMAPDIQVIGEASNGAQGIELAESLDPDLILLDLNMPGMNGLETLDKLREKSLSGRVVVFSVSNHEEDVVTALKRGADGYLLKDMEPEDLLKALQQAAAGEMVLSEALTPVLAASLRANRATSDRDISQLTPRERDILKLIAQGLPNKMIARRLDITESTVKVHVKHMLKKMKLKSRVEAAVWVHQERIF